MELNQMIKDLLKSDVLENQELGTALLKSDTISDDEKLKFIEDFIQKAMKDESIFNLEKRNLYENWLELYIPTIKNSIKNRVKRIT